MTVTLREQVRDWRDDAVCNDPRIDPEMFFPEKKDHDAINEARRICDDCPVWEACLALVMRVPAQLDLVGVYAGFTPADRRDLRGDSSERLGPAESEVWCGGDLSRRQRRTAAVEDAAPA